MGQIQNSTTRCHTGMSSSAAQGDAPVSQVGEALEEGEEARAPEAPEKHAEKTAQIQRPRGSLETEKGEVESSSQANKV